jgi:hypothetical protein
MADSIGKNKVFSPPVTSPVHSFSRRLVVRKYTLFKRKAEDRDSIWYVKVYDAAGKRKAYSTGCTRKEDALDFAELHYGKGKRAPNLAAFVADGHFFTRGLLIPNQVIDRIGKPPYFR